MPDVRVHITVSGIVQGVFFRASAKSEADLLGISGWTRNRADGSVEIVAEGKKEKIDRFVGWCRQGPPGAVVNNITANMDEYKGEFNSFNIAY